MKIPYIHFIYYQNSTDLSNLQTVDQNWSKNRANPQPGHQTKQQHSPSQLLELDLHLLGSEHEGGVAEESAQDVKGGEYQDEGPVLREDDIS